MMAGHDQLPHLLSLLDDESSVVQEALKEQLAAFGDSLGEALASLPTPPDDAQKQRIRQLLAEPHRAWLEENWSSWMTRGSDTAKLEAALSLISEFLDGRLRGRALNELLDDLTHEYQESFDSADPRTLATFLFQEKGLSGDEWNYNHPDNSNLAHVIEEKRGIPISLACVYILVGWRLGLDISGCNFPGHFLARVKTPEGEFFVDCYHEGRFLDRSTLLAANPQVAPTLENILENEIYSDTIVIRVLNNLIRVYEELENPEDLDLMLKLSHQVETFENVPRVPGSLVLSTDPPPPRFEIGELVRHRRYGYRGVVVSLDRTCRADEAWYEKNQTRPNRNQAWYSVLVHGSEQVTYAAENSLADDATKEPVDHPLIREFFTLQVDGTYRRNDRYWPGW